MREIHYGMRAHLLCNIEPVLVYIGHDDTPGAVLAANAHGHHADWACARDKHVLADHIEHGSSMCCIAVGIEKGYDVFRNARRNANYVCFRNAEVLCESAIPVNANAACEFAPLSISCPAVTAVPANDMTFAGHNIPDRIIRNTGAERRDFSHIFMADYHWRPNMLLAPWIPVIDVHIRPANRCFMDFDLHFPDARLRHRHTF